MYRGEEQRAVHPATNRGLGSVLLPAGTVLRSRYKVVEFISQGGMGAIYRAEDTVLEGRMCALKEMWCDVASTSGDFSQAQEQFRREASVLARLDHPNLPKVSDYFTEDSRDYLVMDFVPGKDLKEVMEEARDAGEMLPEKQVLGWAKQILDALEYLHTQDPPVLHRDIKPANIKLTPSGTIKLVDFGLVKLMAPDEERTVTVLQGRGTAQYTPLEQYGGDTGHTDVRSDIYSLGATLYHLLTNQPPADAKMRFLHPEIFKLPRELNPLVSPGVERAILHAIAMHPDDRQSSVEEFRTEIFAAHLLDPIRGALTVPGRLFTNVQQGAGNAMYRLQIYNWDEALKDNGLLLLIVAILVIVALIATILAPNLPSAPAVLPPLR